MPCNVRSLAVSIILASMLPACMTAQAPAGYHLGASVPLPEFSHDSLAAGRITITIERQIASADARYMIELAERLYPDSATISKAVAAETDSVPPWLADASGSKLARDYMARLRQIMDSAARLPGDRWWWRGNPTRTPFALTSAAVAYYLARIRELAADPVSSDGKWPIGALRYRARMIGLADGGQRGGPRYVVDLDLTWGMGCGLLCGMSFRHHRIVYFDADRTPLMVEGDRKPEVVVS